MSNNLKTYTSLHLGCGSDALHITAFVGGEYGYSVQFTIAGHYCALAENQVKDLIATLQKRVKSVKKYQATSIDLDESVSPLKKED